MARWVRFRWPDDFQGDPEEIGEQAGLIVRSDGDVWRATTSDQYYRQPAPQLLQVDAVVTAENRADEGWRARLDRWQGAPGLPSSGLEPRVERVVRELLHYEDDDEPTLEEFFEASRLLFLCLPDGEFPAWIQESLIATLIDSLPDFHLCLIKFAGAIHTRTAFVRGLFTAEHAPEWVAPGTGEPHFSAMSGLAGDGLQGSTRFLDPLLAAHAPWMLGASMSRLRSGHGGRPLRTYAPWSADRAGA